jgi:hypothetical protein
VGGRRVGVYSGGVYGSLATDLGSGEAQCESTVWESTIWESTILGQRILDLANKEITLRDEPATDFGSDKPGASTPRRVGNEPRDDRCVCCSACRRGGV